MRLRKRNVIYSEVKFYFSFADSFETANCESAYNLCVMTSQAINYENLREISDGELIVNALSGREESFEELVRRYQRPITNYVFRMLGNYDASLDVTQEIFIKVYNSLERYNNEYKFSTWIYRISHNAAIDYMRRRPGCEQSLETENENGVYGRQFESKSPSPEKQHEQGEWREEINAVIKLLPDAYKELIILRHTYDLSYDEIAEITDLPLGTVKNRLFRGRELMREIFIKRGFTGLS